MKNLMNIVIASIFLFLLLSGFSYALTQNYSDRTPWLTNTNPGQYGMQFIINDTSVNMTLSNVTFATGTTSTIACLYNYSNWVNISCVPITSLVAVFEIPLYNNNKYTVFNSKEGASHSTIYNNTNIYPSYPIDSFKFIIWQTGLSLGLTYPITSSGSNSSFWMGQLSYGFRNGSISVPADVTPPSISVYQSPSNFTYQSVISGYNIISAIITDATGVDNNSVKIYLQKNDSNVIINGSMRVNAFNRTYTNATGSNYTWYLDENDILGTISNLDTELFENTTHDYLVLTGASNIVKVQFLNMSNNAPLNILEYMTINDTANPSISSYYYCNSSYTTGNPAANINCVMFYSALNNLPFNHTHAGGLSMHKIIPLNIDPNTGKIGSVYVTPTSYILKKGTSTGDRVYYINQTARTDATQTSNNNGNTWTSQTYSIDTHIHLIYNTSSINYKICANDTINPANSACSIWYGDIIDRFTLPPLGVTIYSPVEGQSYLNELLINHSVSFTPTAGISSYDYFWRYANGSFWYNIYNNTGTSYLWDIHSFSSGFYDLKIITRTTSGTYGESFAYAFYINSSSEIVSKLDQILAKLDIIEQNQEENDMTDVSIIIALIGFAFWLVYVANTFNTKTDKNETIYTNTLLKILCYSAAAFVAYMTVQLAYSFGSEHGFSQGILDQLMTNQNLVMWFGLIVLFLLFFGVFGNVAVKIAQNIGSWVGGRKKR